MAAAYRLNSVRAYLSKCFHAFRRSTRPNCNILSSIFMYSSLSRISGGQRNTALTSLSWAGRTVEEACSRTRKRGGAVQLAALTAALSLFGSPENKEEELILLLKKAKLSVAKGELEAASSFLHAAAVIAQQERRRDAIVYTYSQMANLAYVRGQLPEAEKLFKAAMSYMLADGMPQDDNALVEMSLKLAAMYAQQNKPELAEHGFRFCLEMLEAKVQKLQETPVHQRTGGQPGLCSLVFPRSFGPSIFWILRGGRAFEEGHSSSARLVSGLARSLPGVHAATESGRRRLPQSFGHQRARAGPAPPPDMQGHHDDALALIRRAADAGRASGHQDLHVLLANMAAILLHAGSRDEGMRLFREALVMARAAEDEEAVRHILGELERATRNTENAETGSERERAEPRAT
ncbi:tetratricopeptide repeat protein 19, mitochondrial isoform X1 [Stigmatopora argus]